MLALGYSAVKRMRTNKELVPRYMRRWVLLIRLDMAWLVWGCWELIAGMWGIGGGECGGRRVGWPWRRFPQRRLFDQFVGMWSRHRPALSPKQFVSGLFRHRTALRTPPPRHPHTWKLTTHWYLAPWSAFWTWGPFKVTHRWKQWTSVYLSFLRISRATCRRRSRSGFYWVSFKFTVTITIWSCGSALAFCRLKPKTYLW